MVLTWLFGAKIGGPCLSRTLGRHHRSRMETCCDVHLFVSWSFWPGSSSLGWNSSPHRSLHRHESVTFQLRVNFPFKECTCQCGAAASSASIRVIIKRPTCNAVSYFWGCRERRSPSGCSSLCSRPPPPVISLPSAQRRQHLNCNLSTDAANN